MLEIKNISARLGDFYLKNISLEVDQGDYMTILGLSGAGKTVLLEILAGLVKPVSGKILFEGRDITSQKIQQRPFGLVYQDMALFPHMSVKRNILYPLKNKGMPSAAMRERINQLSRLCQVEHLLDRYPGTLSGGEAQRVSLARTLASDPEILLLDEPLANLDVKVRQELRELLRQINKSGKTIIHVTHDHMEAATLSKKIAIIENGELIQWGTPEDVFRNPVSEFVARFSGIKNIFECTFSAENEKEGLFTGITVNKIKIDLISDPGKEKAYVMIPGEDIIVSLEELDTSAINQYFGGIEEIFIHNHYAELIIDSGEKFSVIISKKSLEKLHLAGGKQVWISFKGSAVKIL